MANPGNMSNSDMLLLFGILAFIAFFSYTIAILRLIFIVAWSAVSVIVKYIVIGALVAVVVWAGGFVLRRIANIDNSKFNGRIMKAINAMKE